MDRSWEYINCLQIHECGNWERGRAVAFLGKHKSDLPDAVRFECKQAIKLSGIWKKKIFGWNKKSNVAILLIFAYHYTC